MLQRSIDFFLSAFRWPGLSWTWILLAIALGIACGVAVAGRLPTAAAEAAWAVGSTGGKCFIDLGGDRLHPGTFAGLDRASTGAFLEFRQTLTRWLLVAGIPQVLLSGIVQEATKLGTVIGYMKIGRKHLAPIDGLLVGAVAGAGFGIFEAVWVFNTVFFGGWTWSNVDAAGIGCIMAVLGTVLRGGISYRRFGAGGVGVGEDGWGGSSTRSPHFFMGR